MSNIEELKNELLNIRREGIFLEGTLRGLSEDEKILKRLEYKKRLNNVKRKIAIEKVKERGEGNDKHKGK